MILESTPYIKLRKSRGLINIDFTQCDIIGLNENSSTAAARSYNTIIGVYTRTSSGQKVYLETSGVYSQTTAAKHKPRAARLAEYNGYNIIKDIKPEILHDIYFYNKYNIDEILKESQQRRELLEELKNNQETGRQLLALSKAGVIKARKLPETKQYKNGNRLVKYYYKTNFKYCSNIYWEVNQKAIKYTRPAFNGPRGPRPPATGRKYKINIVNISW